MTAFGLPDGGDEKPGRPPVHYQISVTGRQAGFFFLLLLAALALSFFLGMRTGAAARRGPGAVATLAAASDLPVPTLAPSESAREGRKAETPAEKPTEAALGFAADKRAAPKERAAAATPAGVPTPVPEKPSTSKAAEPPPPKEASASKAVPKGPFWVQVLATKKAPAADELVKRLKSEGFAGEVSAVPGKDGWFRVRVGPFKDRSKAEATARKIKVTDKQIKNTPLVTP
ncbi:MAG TPA: SPOR domain-containing protein [Thermoanaerobaculia bacterium]|nr:SPOR domain-containing protein [Thermoanaerobaculia bacterium]